MVRAGNTTRVKKTDRPAKFISWHMGVAVEEQIEAFGRLWRWDMLEPDAHPFNFQVELIGPVGTTVAIARDDPNRGADLLQGINQEGRTHVPEVPYFVGPGDPGQDLGRQSIVSVGEDCDPHAKIAPCGIGINPIGHGQGRVIVFPGSKPGSETSFALRRAPVPAPGPSRSGSRDFRRGQ